MIPVPVAAGVGGTLGEGVYRAVTASAVAGSDARAFASCDPASAGPARGASGPSYAETGPFGRPVALDAGRYAPRRGGPEGRLSVVAGSRERSGPGRLLRFRVEVEDGLGVDGHCFGMIIEDILWDPRSWGGTGRVSFARVDGDQFDFSIVLASPETTDELCRPLRTGGVLSCRKQDRVIVNAWRWLFGAEAFGGDVAAYRAYLVNHEVGHLLGHGHRTCSGRGDPAPVMMQQTKGVADCAANGWPLRSERP